MKKLILSTIAIAFVATPVFAAKTTVEFVSTDGEKTVIVFNDEDMTAVINDADAIPYTFDETTKTICGKTKEGDTCVTFDELGREVGFSTGYKNTLGVSGTATITTVE